MTMKLMLVMQEQEGFTIHTDEKARIRGLLVSALIALSKPADRGMRAQVAETVAIIAEYDFPERWPDLIDVRTAFLFFSSS